MEIVMNPKKDIIIFSDGLGNSGVHRVTSELADAWARKGHHVTLVYLNTSKKGTDHNDFYWNKDIEFIEIKTTKRNLPKYLKACVCFTRILRKRKQAVAVSLSILSNFVLGFCSPFIRNQIVLSDRNDPTRRPEGRTKQKLRNWCFKRADTIILQTNDVKDYYIRNIGKEGLVIPNPVNETLPVAYNGEREKIIVTASRLNKQKNLPMLVRAFTKLHEDFPEYVLAIYGRGEEEEHLKELILSLHMEDSILLKGFCDDIFNTIKTCSIYVCSSDYEGISNSLLEAMALGMPVISTDCPVGGSKLLINSGENGLLVDVGNDEMLYQAMHSLLSDPALARKIGKNAQYVREKYAIDAIAQKWLDTFR